MIKALIVDDEKSGRDSLQMLLGRYCKEVEVIGQEGSVESAHNFIMNNHPELVFLDIEMPQGSGFELLKKFDSIQFKTIFVTAHQHYAIKAIKFSAFDYLLKPIDVDELVEAVQRVTEMESKLNANRHHSLLENVESNKIGKIAVNVKDGLTFIKVSDIIRLQADGSYTHIFTTNEKFTATRNIKEFEEILHTKDFFRTHNSHIINLHHVKHFSRVDGYFAIMLDGTSVEVSRRRKDLFLQLMNI
jgi:two-component system LytT family response regulator